MLVMLIVNTITFFVVSKILPGFKIKSLATAIGCSLVQALLSVLAAIFLIPALFLLLPVFIIAGPFANILAWAITFAIQVGLLMATDYLIEDFEIDTTQTAVVGAFLMTVVGRLLGMILH